ncbi:uncharacterized protein LOC129008158 [Pongo pygmaeus]|uniref:uncharacterized protein LOC103891812 n=1 Tax=Pongo abelii TaxID=9601 RepID=UPI0023E30B9E|nr:uncharacterized protein LOC103891812 [Pongo abelii]XP_054295994.1 uncharacterized protein LOC129008158 [Pongo pygmaeus]
MGSGAEPVTVTVLFREEGRRNQSSGRLSGVVRRCPQITGSMTLGEWELRESRDMRVNCSPRHRWRPEPSSLGAPERRPQPCAGAALQWRWVPMASGFLLLPSGLFFSHPPVTSPQGKSLCDSRVKVEGPCLRGFIPPGFR